MRNGRGVGGGIVLQARAVEKTFVDGDRITPVLRGVSLAIGRGTFVALMGPSGSGKSTLLSILGTLLRPTAGSVSIEGTEVTGFDEDALTELRNRHVGFVFQFHHLLPDFTALENVLFPSYAFFGRERDEARRRARDLLVRMGLEGRLDYRVTQLSGGQKQRVAIARALMMRPAVVLADEPTGNLDRHTSAEVMDLLAELSGAEEIAFLISTHDPGVAGRCERVLHLLDGRLQGEEPAPR